MLAEVLATSLFPASGWADRARHPTPSSPIARCDKLAITYRAAVVLSACITWTRI